MKLLILGVGGAVAAIVLLAGVVGWLGSRLPRSHTASRSALLDQSPQHVYAIVRDFASAPSWRSDVKHVEVKPGSGGPLHFREEGRNGTINYELAEDVPAARIVTRILDTNLGYSGRWTYTFSPEGGGTRLTITEDGEVSNVFFRFMSRYVFGHTATLDAYLTAVARRSGETEAPK